MIHVAPCSCELHVEIRRLEEEKDYAIEQWRVKVHELEAELAEHAEHEGGRYKGWKNSTTPEYRRLTRDWQKALVEVQTQKTRAEKAETRIAELDGQLGALMDYIASNGLHLPTWTKPILEAREREAD